MTKRSQIILILLLINLARFNAFAQSKLEIERVIVMDQNLLSGDSFGKDLPDSSKFKERIMLNYIYTARDSKLFYLRGNIDEGFYLKRYDIINSNIGPDTIKEFRLIKCNKNVSASLNKFIRSNVNKSNTAIRTKNTKNSDNIYWYFSIISDRYDYSRVMARHPFLNRSIRNFYKQIIYRTKVKKIYKNHPSIYKLISCKFKSVYI